MSIPAVFIDRDGVINALVADPASGRPESPLITADVALVKGAAAALLALTASGRRVVGVSNQPAAAKGTATLEQIHAVQARVLELLAVEGVRLDDFRLCLHHPEAVVEELRGPCDCRKPAPGMLLSAARELDLDLAASWMVGDTDADVLAGQAAGCATILIRHSGSAHKRRGQVCPTGLVADLRAAADRILGSGGVH